MLERAAGLITIVNINYLNEHYCMFIQKPKALTLMAMSVLLREFARRLRQLRRQADLTQEKLAERSGLSRNYVAQLEQGKQDPSLTSLRGLSTALFCSLDELTGTPVHRLADEPKDFKLKNSSEKRRRIMDVLWNCDAAGLEFIAEVIEASERFTGKRK